MQIAVPTFDGFNEIDSFVVSNLLNRLRPKGWNAWITAPADRVASKNGVVVAAQRPLEYAAAADAVVIGSGTHTDAIAEDPAMLARIRLDPRRQLIASWMIAQVAGEDAARDALFAVAPVGEKDDYIDRAMEAVRPFLASRERLAS